MKAKTVKLGRLYLTMKSRFGFLNWWPGETKDEIVIGAILTQNTSWKNVEKAIKNLKEENVLSISKIAACKTAYLEELIRPSGFYKQKASRLKGFASHVIKRYGTLDKMFRKNEKELRKELLSLNGIGNETADSIILYAAEKPVFVIDAYTKRIMGRVYGFKEKELEYQNLQKLIQEKIQTDVTLYKDFHAQFVELAKNYCKKEPLCENCPINKNCKYDVNEKLS